MPAKRVPHGSTRLAYRCNTTCMIDTGACCTLLCIRHLWTFSIYLPTSPCKSMPMFRWLRGLTDMVPNNCVSQRSGGPVYLDASHQRHQCVPTARLCMDTCLHVATQAIQVTCSMYGGGFIHQQIGRLELGGSAACHAQRCKPMNKGGMPPHAC